MLAWYLVLTKTRLASFPFQSESDGRSLGMRLHYPAPRLDYFQKAWEQHYHPVQYYCGFSNHYPQLSLATLYS